MEGDTDAKNSVGAKIVLLYKCILNVGFYVCGLLAVNLTASRGNLVFDCWGSVRKAEMLPAVVFAYMHVCQ